METDMKYLKAVCEGFQELKDRENICYIEEKIDYSQKKVLNDIKNWIKNFYSA